MGKRRGKLENYKTVNPFKHGFTKNDFLLLCTLKPKRELEEGIKWLSKMRCYK